MANNTYTIQYNFVLEDGRKNSFRIDIDNETMLNAIPQPDEKPFWTALEYEKCSCCPLDVKVSSHCPIALNIMGLVDTFKNMVSSDKCGIYCITPERTYSKEATIQEGLFSIFGIINATSRCPIMSFFKPMARFHLPFASVEETTVRVMSFYLMSQYFKQKKRATIDIHLEKLDEHFSKVQMVDEGILNRIRKISNSDADKNAILVLNSLAQLISLEIDEQLQSIENIFNTAG